MDNYIYIGKITSTHGLKGELKIKSNFTFKDKIFKIGQILYIGSKLTSEEIISYRKHKDYDLVIFKNYNNINEVEHLRNCDVYVKRGDLNLINNEVLNEDIIGFKAYTKDEEIGILTSIDLVGLNNEVCVISNKKKNVLIPKQKEFIDRIDFHNRKIYFNVIEGMIE